MNAPSSAAPSFDDETPFYFEAARSYVSAYALFAAMCFGLVIDMVEGGAAVHLVGWFVAIVVVVGLDAMAIRVARRLRSITVTEHEVRVGDRSLARSRIVTVERDVDPTAPVLGQTMREGLPRGVVGIAAHLSDGGVIAIPTRHPDRLARVLQLSVASASLPPQIRAADADDLAGLAEIDRRAATLFRVSGIDLPEIPFPADALHDARAVFVADRPAVGYVRVDEVDGLAHVEGLAVVPASMRRGIGTSLLEAACEWAVGAGYRAVTLITFAEVSWNAPFYARRNFAITDELTPEIAELRDWEHAVGLDALGRRVVMRREL